MRPAAGKTRCIVCDEVGLTWEHGPITGPIGSDYRWDDASAAAMGTEAGRQLVRRCSDCGALMHASVTRCVGCGEALRTLHRPALAPTKRSNSIDALTSSLTALSVEAIEPGRPKSLAGRAKGAAGWQKGATGRGEGAAKGAEEAAKTTSMAHQWKAHCRRLRYTEESAPVNRMTEPRSIW